VRVRSQLRVGHLTAAGGLGCYLGAAAAGLAAAVTGHAFEPASPWLAGAPVGALLGTGVGVVVAARTRGWLAPRLPHRIALFSLAGLLTMPLASAVGQLRAIASFALPLIAVGAMLTVGVRIRAFRARPRPLRPGAQSRQPAGR